MLRCFPGESEVRAPKISRKQAERPEGNCQTKRNQQTKRATQEAGRAPTSEPSADVPSTPKRSGNDREAQNRRGAGPLRCRKSCTRAEYRQHRVTL